MNKNVILVLVIIVVLFFLVGNLRDITGLITKNIPNEGIINESTSNSSEKDVFLEEEIFENSFDNKINNTNISNETNITAQKNKSSGGGGGSSDSANPQTTTYIFYRDYDNDGFGNPSDIVETIENTFPESYVTNNADCNDSNPNIFLEAIEYCDGLDNDCKNEIDEGCICEGDSAEFCNQFDTTKDQYVGDCENVGCSYWEKWCEGADMNRNGNVDGGDLSVLLAYFNNENCSEPSWCEGADIDRGGYVDGGDLSVFLNNNPQENCNESENINIKCYSENECFEAEDFSSCNQIPNCTFKWESFCLNNSDCDIGEKCVNKNCDSEPIFRCNAFMNSVWSATRDILADGIWDRSGSPKIPNGGDYLEVVPANGGYALRIDADNKTDCIHSMTGDHCYERIVSKDLDNLQTWGGTMYMNLQNLNHTWTVPDFVFAGAYDGEITNTQRDLGIVAYNSQDHNYNRDGKSNIYLKAYEHNCQTGCSEEQRILIPDASYIVPEYHAEWITPWPDRFIQIDWFFTPQYNLYTRIDKGKWNKIEPLGIRKNNFTRFDIGLVSSYSSGTIDIKDVSLYDEACVPQWVLEN